MDTEKCRAVLCAIEEGTITQAAEKLGYTVSGVSKMIAALEQEAGFALLNRSKSGVVPTDECRQLIPYMRSLVESAEACSQAADAICGIHRGSVRLGTSYQNYFRDFAAAVAQFHTVYPNISVELEQGTSSQLVNKLRDGSLDLCLISEREDCANFTVIARDEIMAWVPDTEEYCALSSYPLNRLLTEPYISIYPEEETDNSRLLKRCGLQVSPTYGTTEVFAAMSLAEAGLGTALINRLLAENIHGNLITLPLDPPQYINIGIAEKARLSPAAARLKDFLLKSLLN